MPQSLVQNYVDIVFFTKTRVGWLREAESRRRLLMCALRQYIHHQAEHCRKESLQDELRGLFGLYGIEYDERYVWD